MPHAALPGDNDPAARVEPRALHQAWEIRGMELTFTSDLRLLSECRERAGDFLFRHLFHRTIAEDMVMVVDEALTNIVQHSCAGTSRPVQMLIRLEAVDGGDLAQLKFVFADQGDGGRSFRPSERLRQSQALLASQGVAGGATGFGVVLMHQLMDQVEYRTASGGGNLLILRKWFCNRPSGPEDVRRLLSELRQAGALPLPETGPLVEAMAETLHRAMIEEPGQDPGEVVIAAGAQLGIEIPRLRQNLVQARLRAAGHASEELWQLSGEQLSSSGFWLNSRSYA